MNSVNDLDIGKAAEHLVMADLILGGHSAYLTDQRAAYNIAIDAGDRFFRVQVKATRALRAVPQRAAHTPGYLFNVKRAGQKGLRRYGAKEFDILALVALDIRAIAYMPFPGIVPESIILRPPGAKPAKNASRTENIDQFPIEKALEALTQL